MEHSWPVMHLSSVDSTNNFLLRLIETGQATHEMVINARFQNQGRGQESNTWESDPCQNLTFSLLLKPEYLKASSMFFLNQAISLAIIDYLEDNQIFARIKWPNDILVGCKKIAGILIENSFLGDKYQHAVVGIGLNVNQEYFPDLQHKAISMKNLLGKDLNLDVVLHRLLNAIHQRIKYLKRGDFDVLADDYKKHLHLFQCWATYRNKDESFKGKILDVKPSGELCILLENGEVREFLNKEVAFV
ncbi:MAG TPA: biotin--[acetyl-CoA-carboxylase] ligase [Bacteroidales bacterium]|nr:biotin--[acetyl-CoA-carboxylase] ligase [Bacteroidales bacterium]HOK99305.1 biotin--[acetyl-CoA-carboxylase] ligase [Bacteroidales bacterium]HPO66663.1 biotin--[acetyl-CoA-carboxylase] ligase [Bacteroidales bacterium]